MTYEQPSNTIKQSSETQKRASGGRRGNKNARKHGHHARKLKLTDVRLEDISQQNGPGRLLAAKAEAIFADRGGRDVQTELQRDTVDRYLVNELLRQSVAHWLLQQPSLVNRRKRSALPVIKEYISLTETSQRLASAIGLERVEPPPMDLAKFLAQRAAEAAAAERPTESPSNSAAASPASRNEPEPAPQTTGTSTPVNVSAGREPNGRFSAADGDAHD